MFSFFLDLSRKLPGVASPLKIASLESDDNRIFTYETLNRSKRSYPKILGNNEDGGGKTGEGEGPLLKKGAFPLPKPHPYPPKTFVRVDVGCGGMGGRGFLFVSRFRLRMEEQGIPLTTLGWSVFVSSQTRKKPPSGLVLKEALFLLHKDLFQSSPKP